MTEVSHVQAAELRAEIAEVRSHFDTRMLELEDRLAGIDQAVAKVPDLDRRMKRTELVVLEIQGEVRRELKVLEAKVGGLQVGAIAMNEKLDELVASHVRLAADATTDRAETRGLLHQLIIQVGKLVPA